MKILVLFGPGSFGGSFVIAAKVAQKYVDAGHQVVMLVKDPYSIELYKSQGFEVITIQTMKREIAVFHDILSVYKLIKCFKRYECDVIHSHTSKGGFYSRLAKLFCSKINVIHTVHGYYKVDNNVKNNIFDVIEKLLLPLGDVTTFVNFEDYNNTKSSRSKLMYIPNGVEVELYKTNRSFNGKTFNIVINARIVWEKGYREIIELIRRFEMFDIHFHIIGIGSDELEVKKQLSIYKNVIFHGFVKDIKSVLFGAQLNLLPSYREGLSLSILEAMASGIPTIAFDIRGNRELIENGIDGYLCTLYDINELEERIRYYFDNRLICYEHGQNAHEKVLKEYNSKDVYKRYLEALLRISAK